MQSAYQHPAVVTEYPLNERMHGRILGPFDSAPVASLREPFRRHSQTQSEKQVESICQVQLTTASTMALVQRNAP